VRVTDTCFRERHRLPGAVRFRFPMAMQNRAALKDSHVRITLVRALALISTCCLWCVCAVSAAVPDANEEDPTEGTVRLSIPEPMYFDLVRPLGASCGEVEVNALFLKPTGTHLEWAPEIEMVLGRGLALEFELPFEGAGLQTYKVAAQAKLPTIQRAASRYIHGWQLIGEIPRAEVPFKAAGLYISGIRWSERISSLSLNGVEVRSRDRSTRTSPLLNNSLFYEKTPGRTVGLESNVRFERRTAEVQVLPQIHRRLFGATHLQLAVGVSRSSGHSWQPVVGWRLVRHLN
jgi:hypothetical protein